MSRPGRLHGVVCMIIGAILMAYAQRRKKGYVCSNDTGLVVARDPDSVRGPDLMFFDDANTIADVDLKWGTSPPLLSVEVLSPNDKMTEVLERIAEQLTAGTKMVWLVDPVEYKVTVFRPNHLLRALGETDEITGEDVLPDFRCKVADFFKLPGQQ